jgi:hypothetical protein
MNRLLVLGGAVLVLAACDSATAPISLHEGSAASVKKAPVPGQTTSSAGSSTLLMEGGCSWYHSGSGGDSTFMCLDQ